MDKKVIFAVAGSGKTTRLIESLDDVKRFLIVTYTESNYKNLRNKIIKKFGYFPINIKIYTYFRFLYGFCYRPFLSSKKNTKGITFNLPSDKNIYSLTNDLRFMTRTRWVYANRLAKFIEQSNLNDAVVARMEKYFDVFFVDEVQDFAGHDFNFLMGISIAKLDITFVGDFFQHTYDTSRDGTTNKNLHKEYKSYLERYKKAKLIIDTDSLKKSHRCSKTVCNFIYEKIGIQIEAHDDRESNVKFEDNPEKVLEIYNNSKIVKLFYSEHHKYDCYSQNWGASKGEDRYLDVCVVLNKSGQIAWKNGNFKDINPITRNKFYVACSRARQDLIFISETLLKDHKKK